MEEEILTIAFVIADFAIVLAIIHRFLVLKSNEHHYPNTSESKTMNDPDATNQSAESVL